MGVSGIGSIAAVVEAGLGDGGTRARDLVVDRLGREDFRVAGIEDRSSISEVGSNVESGGSGASSSSECTIVGIASARRRDSGSIDFASRRGRYLRNSLETAIAAATEGGGSILKVAVKDLRFSVG